MLKGGTGLVILFLLIGACGQILMSLEEVQKTVDDWIKTKGVCYFGELAQLMSRQYGDQSCKESDKNRDLGDEIADVMFVLLTKRV